MPDYQSIQIGEDDDRVAPAHGRAFRVDSEQTIDVIAPLGPQVADMWAFSENDIFEHLSTEHTRSCLDRLCPRVGEAFYTNRRRPMLSLEADHSPGDHDLLLSACDQARYDLLGATEPHRNCADNLREALGREGVTIDHVPSPVNLFERVVADKDGKLEITAPILDGGEFVRFKALMPLIFVVSACPMDLVPTNGNDRIPKPIDIRFQGAPNANK